jgi:hypothetical protein
MARKQSFKDKEPIVFENGSAYLPGAKAAITINSSSKDLFRIPDIKPVLLGADPKFKGTRGVVYWGESNNLPQQINEKVYKTPVITSGMLFNICIGYGQGIMPVRYDKADIWHEKPIPVWDNEDINTFFEENDINGYFLEQLTDMKFFFNVFPEIILNRESTPKIVSLTSKEAAFSRWDAMNYETGQIEYHYYSAWWQKGKPMAEQVEVTKVLNSNNPLRDLRIRMGIEKNDKGNFNKPSDYRFIIPIDFPTPNRIYYQKPYWYSIIESGWYDFALKIPEFKNALLTNGMTIKFHVELEEDYFEQIFKKEKIQDDEGKRARIKKEYKDINDFLSGTKNTGKSWTSFKKNSIDGKEVSRVKITPIDDKFKGGEYLQDSEEVSNIMSYGMNVHPSTIGSSPGNNKSINGTEARELFLIKQVLEKPFRDRLLRPLYVIKAFNGWPADIHFIVPDIKLVTLDKNPNGVVTNVGEQPLDSTKP